MTYPESAEHTTRPEEWLALRPRDTVFVRDGRSFDAGADVAADTVHPWPSTLAGAVRAAYGREPAEVRGPVLARLGKTGWRPHFPVPADVVRRPGGKWAYLLRPDPELAPVVTDLGGASGELLAPPRVMRVEPVPGWMPVRQLAAYLGGDLPAGGFDLQLLKLLGAGDEPFAPEPRVGLARTRGRTAREGFLYQSTHLRPRDGWAFLVGCVQPAGWNATAAGPVPLGGRGRLVDVAPATGMGWPEAPERFPDGRVLVYVATPALWPGGWRPELPQGVALCGAAVRPAQPVASASPYLARRDGKRLIETVTLRWAVPAGSVYLLRFTGRDAALRWALEHHGRALGPAMGATDTEDRLRTAGFGVVLTGTWKEPEW
ncbi:MAG: type III-B CRISPR module-associated Cmr3 family protein [Streptomycetales bacterium]